MEIPRILAVTDDGVNADGYIALLRALSQGDFVVDAHTPEHRSISFGTGIAIERFVAEATIPVSRRILDFPSGKLDVMVYDLAPAAVARAACAGVTRSHHGVPCLVAGVNHGPNVGVNLLHSGTFGAALSAFWVGLPALAISLDDVYSVDEDDPGPLRFDVAANIAVGVIHWMQQQPQPVLCNINVPNVCPPGGEMFEATQLVSSVHSGSLLLRSDVEALQGRRVSVTAFPFGSLTPSASLSSAVSQALAILGA